MATSRIPRIGLALLVAALPAIGLLACRGQLSPDGSSASTASVPAPLPAPVAPVTPVTPPAPVEPARPAAPAAVVAQIDQGAALFQRNCAQCHGARGEGTTAAPAVIGTQALPMNPPAGARLRRTTFRAGKDLGMFIMTTMPPQGAKLPPTQVACVLAWLLHQNGATPQQTVSPATAGSMPIHGSR